MKKVFRSQVAIKFREGDPAQIMYFGHLFSLAHDCFEEFIVDAGYLWKEWFNSSFHLIPMRHVEADFLAPFFPGQIYDIDVTVAQLRETSFQMKYVFRDKEKVHGVVRMVHSVLDPQTHKKMKLPTQMRERLSFYFHPELKSGQDG